MKILGLFMVVFLGLLVTRALGFSDMSQIVGAIIGAGTYIMSTK